MFVLCVVWFGLVCVVGVESFVSFSSLRVIWTCLCGGRRWYIILTRLLCYCLLYNSCSVFLVVLFVSLCLVLFQVRFLFVVLDSFVNKHCVFASLSGDRCVLVSKHQVINIAECYAVCVRACQAIVS